MQSAVVSLLVATDLVAPLHGLTTNEIGHEKEVSWPHMTKYKHDCFNRVPAYGLMQLENPGAGMNPDEIVPYQTVLKDGFMMVACVKDAMYEHGDRFGNNRDQYKMLNIANSSIVHYNNIIPKEDRARMTPKVCFEFCRGAPDMVFFGLNNGMDCYCTPFYKPMAGGSSQCDSVCEGDPGQFCGGKIKNSIFSMHSCDSTEKDLEKAVENGKAVEHHMEDVCGSMKDVSDSVTKAARSMQQTFGRIGDPTASNQMQLANEDAGEWLGEAKKCLKLADSVKSLVKDSGKHEGKDFAKYDERKAAEDYTSELAAASDKGTEILAGHVDEWTSVQPSLGSAERQANTFLPKVLDQYYSIMYFVDKEYADDKKFPVTCDGDLIGEPALGFDAQHCAAACDEHVGKCVGFAAYQEGDAVLCFLFSKIKTAQYYTGCKSDEATTFLQKNHVHRDAVIGWAARHQHKVHVNFTAQDKAMCAQKRKSGTCKEARTKISPDGTQGDVCYLTPGNKWTFKDLPGYFECLGACCEDYDPNLMMDGLTCKDLMGYYDKPCPEPLEVSNPPPGTKIETVCPETCKKCDGPVTTALTTHAPPLSTPAPVVVTHVKDSQPALKSEIKAMCRAKFSKIGSASLKPDPSGRSKYALKELKKADRCFD